MLASDQGQKALQQPPHASLPQDAAPEPEAAPAESILEQDPLAAAPVPPAPQAAPLDPSIAAILQQNQQMLQHLAQQAAPKQQQGMTDDQIAAEIERLGGDPTDPFHVSYYTDRMTWNQREQGLAQQVQQMRQEMQHLAVQAQGIRARSEVGPQVAQALKPYGNVPQETSDAIRDGVIVRARPFGYQDLTLGPLLQISRRHQWMGTIRGQDYPRYLAEAAEHVVTLVQGWEYEPGNDPDFASNQEVSSCHSNYPLYLILTMRLSRPSTRRRCASTTASTMRATSAT